MAQLICARCGMIQWEPTEWLPPQSRCMAARLADLSPDERKVAPRPMLFLPWERPSASERSPRPKRHRHKSNADHTRYLEARVLAKGAAGLTRPGHSVR